MHRLQLLLAALVVSLAPAAQAAGDAAAGKQKNFQCMGCHGIACWRTAFP